MEVELKLLIDPAAVSGFKRLGLLRRCALGPARTQRLVSTYFDTPDRQLAQQRLGWRLRRSGRQWVQTIKGEGEALSGLHRRPEWECAVSGSRPDLAALMANPATAAELPAALAAIERELVPIFSTDFRRTVWRLRLPGDTEVELALDQGVIAAAERRLPLSELELELRSGDPAALFDFALELIAHVPLRIGHLSKAERGHALFAPAPHPAHKARRTALQPTLSVEAAFCALVGDCLAQMQANEVGVIEGGDADCLHQMRVGQRRLRTALRLFRRWIVLPPPAYSALEHLAQTLGAARDAEVLADGTLARVLAQRPYDVTLQRLRKAAAAAAAARRRQVVAALVATDHARLMLGLGAWLHGRRWRESLDSEACRAIDAPIDDSAARILGRCHKRLLAADPGTQAAAPEQRHAVRIAAKRLRYAIEFFEGLYPRARIRRSLAHLEALQDSLGALNDVAVAEALLQQMARQRPPLAEAAAFARGFLLADCVAAGASWQPQLKALLRRRVPWR